MIRAFFLAAAVALIATPSLAYCIGSGAFRTCYDDSGNTYTVNKFGNHTMVNGYNAQTSSQWSQDSNTIGNSTYTTGRAANGNNWNETQTRNGGMTTYSGTDADGNSFYATCTTIGCF